MNWKVEIDGRVVELELAQSEDGWLVNGRPVSVIEVQPGIYSVLLEGRSFEARVERNPESFFVNIGGHRLAADLIDPRRLSRRSGALGREGRQSVTAPMPGKVVRVLAAEGDQVEAGHGLLVIEAMKMQNELKAPKSGCVVSVPAKEGANVAAGDILAVIE